MQNLIKKFYHVSVMCVHMYVDMYVRTYMLGVMHSIVGQAYSVLILNRSICNLS